MGRDGEERSREVGIRMKLEVVSVRVPASLKAEIEGYAASLDGDVSPSEACRRLLEIGLAFAQEGRYASVFADLVHDVVEAAAAKAGHELESFVAERADLLYLAVMDRFEELEGRMLDDWEEE